MARFSAKKEVAEYKIFVLFSTNWSEIFLVLRKIQQDAITNLCRPSCRVLFVLDKSCQIFEKRSNIKFHEIRSVGAELFHLT